ncbi:hypothetical protein CYMTET_13129 [Cymbomonas tetramitiformis]|uniref:Uncharacterized protein n=1 Tax=Cymbomonas tetramitiformis TaxID=36881 RepID=A0AAE0GJ60_9CHLO|nr:hypothetical protein CYMTET_13129 [Cymbomonas tetramitiformis]
MAHLMSKGTIKAASLQPYLSAINDYHEGMGYDGPAKGHSVSRAVKGMASLQVEIASTQDAEETVRTWLPTRHVTKVHAYGLAMRPTVRAAMELQRACTYVVFAFVTFGRPNTGVSMQKSHIAVTDDVISVALHKEKGRGHVRLKRRLAIPAAGVEGLVQLLGHWQWARDSGPVTDREGYWRLPWEQGRLMTAQTNDWMQLALGTLSFLDGSENGVRVIVQSSGKRLLLEWEEIHPEGSREVHGVHGGKLQRSPVDHSPATIGSADPHLPFPTDGVVEGSQLRGLKMAAPQWASSPIQLLPAAFAEGKLGAIAKNDYLNNRRQILQTGGEALPSGCSYDTCVNYAGYWWSWGTSGVIVGVVVGAQAVEAQSV